MFVLASKHKIVVTDTIVVEWQNHRARFFTNSLASMYKKRKVCELDVPPDEMFRRKLEEVATDDGIRIAMLKDAHLIEAAFQADRIVISMDERVRRYFSEVTINLSELRKITWANPCKNDEKVIAWLELGARQEQERCLGYNKDT